MNDDHIMELHDVSGNGTYWKASDLTVTALGYTCSAWLETKGQRPSDAYLNIVVSIIEMNEAKVEWISIEMANVFNKYICINYGLAKIKHPMEIWHLITGINGIHVKDNGDYDIEFIPNFDQDHDFAVRVRNGELYEVMLDG